jgi:hypothetical protein
MILPRLFYPTPPFVIPSEESWAFGPPKGMKNVPYLLRCPFPNELSSRPERTRISCRAAMDMDVCAPFCKGKAHEVHQRHQVPQEIRGSVVEGSAVNHPQHQMVIRKVEFVLHPIRHDNPCPLSYSRSAPVNVS